MKYLKLPALAYLLSAGVSAHELHEMKVDGFIVSTINYLEIQVSDTVSDSFIHCVAFDADGLVVVTQTRLGAPLASTVSVDLGDGTGKPVSNVRCVRKP